MAGTATQYAAQITSDHKRRRVDQADAGHVTAERVKGVVTDKAKANYLSGQLRLRLQYAKLKVEHGWQRQTLSEVENLYFRHTHLTRPYPVISPGGRRSGRTLSSNTLSFSGSVVLYDHATSAPGSQHQPYAMASPYNLTTGGASSSGLQHNGTLSGFSSSSSLESATVSSMPSTPAPQAGDINTSHAPHIGFGDTRIRYLSRSDSTATLILESTSSPYPAPSGIPHTKPIALSRTQLSASSSISLLSTQTPSTNQPEAANAFREPFDPMEPTDHLDSQLAALRSIISASSVPIPLPPPSGSAASSSIVPSVSTSTSSASISGLSLGTGSGLTYDAFWSAHGSGTNSYRSVLAGQVVGARASSVAALQAHASAPAVMASTMPANVTARKQDGERCTSSMNGMSVQT